MCMLNDLIILRPQMYRYINMFNLKNIIGISL